MRKASAVVPPASCAQAAERPAVPRGREITGVGSCYVPELFAFSSALCGCIKGRREMSFISKEEKKKKKRNCLMKREGGSVASKHP